MPKPTKKNKKIGEACTSCGPCKGCGIILPLIIIILIWWKPAEMWSQIVITIAAAIIALAKFCPCKSKK